MGEFSRYELTTVKITKNHGLSMMLFNASLLWYKSIMGSDKIKSALAGVGNPTKEET